MNIAARVGERVHLAPGLALGFGLGAAAGKSTAVDENPMPRRAGG